MGNYCMKFVEEVRVSIEMTSASDKCLTTQPLDIWYLDATL